MFWPTMRPLTLTPKSCSPARRRYEEVDGRGCIAAGRVPERCGCWRVRAQALHGAVGIFRPGDCSGGPEAGRLSQEVRRLTPNPAPARRTATDEAEYDPRS